MKRVETVRVFSDEFHSDFNLGKYIDMLKDKYDSIPLEYANSATIKYEVYDEYGDKYVSCEIFYKRPETDEEYEARTAKDLKYKTDQLQSLKLQVDRLSEEIGLNSVKDVPKKSFSDREN